MNSHKTIEDSAIAIIVPILNEAAQMPALLAHLSGWRARGCELVLVDGGSDDDSVALARAQGYRVLEGTRGRARQMNLGAGACRQPVLLFLHADTCLPSEATAQIAQALVAPGRCWGRFDVSIRGEPALLKLIAAMMNWRSRLSGIATGDQAIFVRREAFERVGGFAEQPLMEDIELSRQLKKLAAPCCLRSRVSTSGRRWLTHGTWRTIWLMWQLRWAYWRGVPASQLARLYH